MGNSNRVLVLVSAALLLLLGVMGTTEAMGWVGKPFPGFLVLENRVVASVGLAHWAATEGGQIYQHEIVAVDGAPLERAASLTRRVRSLPVGHPLVYTFRRGPHEFERTIPTERFTFEDFLLLFGVYLLNGAVMGGTALVLWRRGSRSARACVPLLAVGALWGLTAMDLYGPYRLFRLHALCEVLLFPAALHLALAFPQPLGFARTRRSIVWIPYAFAGGLAVVYQAGLLAPASYVLSHLIATTALGISLLVLLGALVGRYVRPASLGLRRDVGVLVLGSLVALVLPVCLTLAEVHTGGRMPQNAVGFTAFLFPLAIGYTALRADLRASRDLPTPS